MNEAKPAPKRWILIRGLSRSRFHWKNFGIKLKSKLDCKVVESPEIYGNGYFHREPTPNNIALAVSQLRAQLKEPIGEPVGIIGISLGGVLATYWAQKFPQEVSHLVIINSSSGLSPFYKRLIPRNYYRLIQHLISPQPEQLEKLILSTTSNNRNIWEAQVTENIEFLKVHPVSAKNFLRQLDLATQVDFTEVPVAHKLVLTSKADRLVSAECSEIIAKQWSCEIQLHEKAGHDLSMDDANWVIDKIKNSIS